MKTPRTSFAVLAPYLWLALFFALPFLMVAKLSLSHAALSVPPYAPQLEVGRGWAGVLDFLRQQIEPVQGVHTGPQGGSSLLVP
jgi:putrescine transport system permease protein